MSRNAKSLSVSGLSSKKARNLLLKHGKNERPEKPPPSDLKILLSQLKNPLVYVLIGAGSVTFVLGHLSDTILIISSVALNTILGFSGFVPPPANLLMSWFC